MSHGQKEHKLQTPTLLWDLVECRLGVWRIKKSVLFAALRVNLKIPEEWTHPPKLAGGRSLLKWPHSAPWLWRTPCLNYSWQSLSSTQHPFANWRVATFRSVFVVVQLKCIAGCLCYWNTVECSKWLPLMPFFCFVAAVLVHKEQLLRIMYVFPLLFSTRKWRNELWSLWHLVTYYCCYFWLRWGIFFLALRFSFISTKAPLPAIGFMVPVNNSRG